MSDFRVTKKQNVVVDGVKYKAKPSGSCDACVLKSSKYDGVTFRCNSAPCLESERVDGRRVIFVKKNPK